MDRKELQKFRSECLASHNYYRSLHRTAPLTWNSGLADSAQSWAEQLARSDSLKHSNEKGLGENIACFWGSELTGAKVTQIWYEENQHFDYESLSITSRTRPFCQVIWQGTRQIGAGKAKTVHGKEVIVARYRPAAKREHVAKNVRRPVSEPNLAPEMSSQAHRVPRFVGLRKFQEECLLAHNEYRFRHGAPPLRWSFELSWEAQQWAEELAQQGELKHNLDDSVGENLAGMLGDELTGREATDMWYNEIEDYDFDSPGYGEDTSNFTQVVWVASENFGVGRAIEGDLSVVVAFYDPPGNIEEYFDENVLKIGSMKKLTRRRRKISGLSPPLPDLEMFRIECLVTHNFYRARHGSPPLILTSTLTNEAQYWAERLLVTGTTEDLENSRIGISVAFLEWKHVSGITLTEMWYSQIFNYNFDSPGFNPETKNFTQLVWSSSRRVGIGKADDGSGFTVVVARYEPVGNIDGLFVPNVRRRGFERAGCEPTQLNSDVPYKVRVTSKSASSFLSWENEGTQVIGMEPQVARSSDMDENSNVVSTFREEVKRQSSTDQFTQLVWIDGSESPRVEDPPTCEEQANDGSMVYVTEQLPSDDEPEEPVEEDVHEALVYSEPEVELSPHDLQFPRPQSICSDIVEIKAGSVLSKISFWEQVSQEGSRSSKVYDDDAENLTPELTSEGEFTEDEEDFIDEYQPIETIPEVEEQELEYDDVFPAHVEETESYSPVEFEDHYIEDDETYDECVDRNHVIYVHPAREAPEATTGSPDEGLQEPEDIFSSEMEDTLEHEEGDKDEEDIRDVFSEEMEGVLEHEEAESVESSEETEIIFESAPPEFVETELATRSISPDSERPPSDHLIEKNYDRQEELETQMTHLSSAFGFVCIKQEPEPMKRFRDEEFQDSESEDVTALFAEHHIPRTQQQQYTGPACMEEDVTFKCQQRELLETVNLEELFAKLQQKERPVKDIEQKSEEVQVPSDLCVFKTLDREKIKDIYFKDISRRLKLVAIRTQELTERAQRLELEISDDVSPSRVERSEVKGPVCDEKIEASTKTDVEAELDFDKLFAKLEFVPGNEDTVNVEIDSKLQSDADIKRQLSEDISDEELVEYGEFANFEQELYREKEVFEESEDYEKGKHAPLISVSDEELVEYGESESEEELDDVFTEQFSAGRTTVQTTTETKVTETRSDIHERREVTIVRHIYKSESKGDRTESTKTVTETIIKPAETENSITSKNCRKKEEIVEIEDVAFQAPLFHVTEELSSNDSLEHVTEEDIEDEVDFAETIEDDPVYMSEFRVREAHSPVQIAGEIDTFSAKFEELVEGASFDSEVVKYYPGEEEVSTLEQIPERAQSPIYIAGDVYAYRTRGDSVISAASFELYDAQYYPEDEQITVEQLSETDESSAYLTQDLIDQEVEEQLLEQSSEDEQAVSSFQEHQVTTIKEDIREIRPPLQMVRSIEQTDPFDGIQQQDEEEILNKMDFAVSYEEFAERYEDVRIVSDEVRKRPLSLVHIAAEVLEKQIDMEVQQELLGREKAQEYRSVEDIELFVQKEENLVSLVNMTCEFSESEHDEEVEELEYAPVNTETAISFDGISESLVEPSFISPVNVAGVIDKRLTIYDSSVLETDEKPDSAQTFEEDDLQEREKFVSETFLLTNVAAVVEKRRTIYEELDVESAGQSESALTYEENEFQEQEKFVDESLNTPTNIAAEVEKRRTIYEEYDVESLEQSESAVSYEEDQFQEQERAVGETEEILLNVAAVREKRATIYEEFSVESIEQPESAVTYEEDDLQEQEKYVDENEDKPTNVAAVVEKRRTIYDEFDTESPDQPESALNFAEEEIQEEKKSVMETEEITANVAAVLEYRRSYEEFDVESAEEPESAVFYEEDELKEQENSVDEADNISKNVAAIVEKRRTIYDEFDTESPEQPESALLYEEDEFQEQEQYVDENEDKPTNIAAVVEKRRTIYDDFDTESPEQPESALLYEEDEVQEQEQYVDENEDKPTNIAAVVEKRRTIYDEFDTESPEQPKSALSFTEEEMQEVEKSVEEIPSNVAALLEHRRTSYEEFGVKSAEEPESAVFYEEDELKEQETSVDEAYNILTNVDAVIEKRRTVYDEFDEESAQQQESALLYEEDELQEQEKYVDENEDKPTNIAAVVEKRRTIYDEFDTEIPEQPESALNFTEEEIQEDKKSVEETEEIPANVVAILEHSRTNYEMLGVESAEQPESVVFYEEDELKEQENSVDEADNISTNVTAVIEKRRTIYEEFGVETAEQSESAVTYRVDDLQEQERSVFEPTDTSTYISAVVEERRTIYEEFVEEIAESPESAENVEENQLETYEHIAKDTNESNVHIATYVEKRRTLYEEAELNQIEERDLGQFYEEDNIIESSRELNEQTTVPLHLSAVVVKHNYIIETLDEEQRVTHDVQMFEEAIFVEQEAITEVCHSPLYVSNEFEAGPFTETDVIEDDYEQLSTREIEDDDVVEEVTKLDICNSPVNLASEFEETFEDEHLNSELENINVEQTDEYDEEEASAIEEIYTNDSCQSPIHTVSELEHRTELQKTIQVEEELEEIANVIRYSEQRFLTSDISTEVCIGSPVHMAAELDEPEELLEDIETEPEDEQNEKGYSESYELNEILSRTDIVHGHIDISRQVAVEEVNQEIGKEDLEGLASTESVLVEEKSSSAVYEEEVEVQFVKEESESFELANDNEDVEEYPDESGGEPAEVLLVEGVDELKEHAEAHEIQRPEEPAIQDVAIEEEIDVGSLVFEEETEIQRVKSKESEDVSTEFILVEGISAIKEYEGNKEVQVFTEEVEVLKLEQPEKRILAEQDDVEDKARVFEEEIEVGRVHIIELEQHLSREVVDQDEDLEGDISEEEVEMECLLQSDRHSPVIVIEMENAEIKGQVFEEEIEVQRVDIDSSKQEITIIMGTQSSETEDLNWSKEQKPALASQHLFEEEIEIYSVPSELSQLHQNVVAAANITENIEIVKIQETCSERKVKHEIRQDVKTEILVVKHNGHVYANEAFQFDEDQTSVESRLIENFHPESLYEEEVELHRVDREFSVEKDELELFEEEIEVPGFEKLFQDEPRKIIHLYYDESETELEPLLSEHLSEEYESEERDPSEVSEDEVQEIKKDFEECKVFIECPQADSTSKEYEEPYEFTPVSPPPIPTAFEEVCESEPEDTDEESIETLTRFEEYDKPTIVELHSLVMPQTLIVEDQTQSVQAGEVNEMFEEQFRNFDEPKYCEESTSTEEKDMALEKFENGETLILLEPFEPEAEIFEYVESVEDAEVVRADQVECQREIEEGTDVAVAKSESFETPQESDSKEETDTTILHTREEKASIYKIDEEQKTEEGENKTVIRHEMMQVAPGYTSETVTSSKSKQETIISATSTRKMFSSSSAVVSSQFTTQTFSSSAIGHVQSFPSHDDPEQTLTSSSSLQRSFVSSYSKSETIMSSTTKKETTVSVKTQQYSSAETSSASLSFQKETLALEEDTNIQEEDEKTDKEEEATTFRPSESPELRIYEKESETTARYYVDYSPGGSFEQDSEGQSEEGEEYDHVYIQQGEPLEEDLEEFMLVRYGDDYTSSEDDTSDHREMYVIPEESNESEEEPHEGAPKVIIEHVQSEEEEHEEEVEMFEKAQDLEEVQEEDEDEGERSREEVELEEYERLESLVILEDKLSHMESDDENNEDEIFGKMEPAPPLSKSSSEETLQEDEFGETMTGSTLYSMIESEQQETEETAESNSQGKGLPPRAMTEEDDEDEEDRKTEEETQHESEERFEENKQLLQEMAEGEDPSITDEPTQEISPRTSTRSQASSEGEEEQKEQQPRSGVLSCERTKESGDWSPILTKRLRASQSFEDSYSSRSEGEQSFCSETSSHSTPSEDEDMNEFQRQCLRVHNKYRRQHGVIPLTWSPELAADAERWVKHLAAAEYQEHCGHKDVGENLISVKGEELTGDKTADLWYGEVRDYSFESPAYDARCGNFTQMIWAGTREFAVARRMSSDGTHYVVARYRPPGNVLGEFRENVKPGDVEALIASRRRSNSGERPRRISRRRRSSRSRSNPDILQEREKFKKECLITHNYYRSIHDARPMNWSPLLAAEAQSWADKLARTDSFKHSGDKDRGENLAFVRGSELTPMKATEMWYDEVKDYDFSLPGFTSNTGHFTQVVWVGTEQFGMGRAVGEDGTQIMVGRYYPPGNIVGTFHENVKPNKFGTR